VYVAAAQSRMQSRLPSTPPPSFQRSAAELAIAAAVFAAGALGADGHEQAVTKQDQEVCLGKDLYPLRRWQEEGSGTSAAIAPHVRS